MPTGITDAGTNLGLYLGMTLEVLTTENKPIFIGRTTDMDDDAIDIASASGGEVPPVLYNTEIRLRGFLPGMRPIMLSGVVCGSAGHFWRVHQLKSLYVQENRGFFASIFRSKQRSCALTLFFSLMPAPCRRKSQERLRVICWTSVAAACA